MADLPVSEKTETLESESDSLDVNYKPPEKKTVAEILSADQVRNYAFYH